MHRLRASLLLRRSEAVLIAALLVTTQGLFLWMFLSADPLEQIARADDRAMRFAADWRHGMAGNAWLYMPGFFATAGAVWLCGAWRSRRLIATTLVASAAAALAAAAVASPAGARHAIAAFQESNAIILPGPIPQPSAVGVARGLYTLATWSVFVLACRRAMSERTWRPFVAPCLMTVGLALVRPWTVDDFTAHWWQQLAAGDPIACVSAASAVAMGALLASSVQRSQRRCSPNSPAGTRRAETTSSM